MPGRWKGVCIHHSATPDGASSSWEAIRRFHVQTNGWQEIGYHFGVEDVGGLVRLRIGRPLNLPGAHARGLNNSHLGICVVGDYDKQPPTDAHLDVLSLAVADLARFYGFDITDQSIRYHNEVAEKTCPGRLFPDKNALIARIRSLP